MFYQLKVDLRDGRIIGGSVAALCLPGHGDISLSQSIPLAETNRSWHRRVGAEPGVRLPALQRAHPERAFHQPVASTAAPASFIGRCRSVFRRHEVSPTSAS
jgi:hypothetical protein